MRVLVTGAAGMIGRKLAERLARDGAIGDAAIAQLVLADAVEPDEPASAGFEVRTVVADLTESGVAEELISTRPDVVFHLAAVLSGEAEEELELGYRVNLDGTRALLDAVRGLPDYCPRVVFSSTIAVFGAPFPEVIGDDHLAAPLTSYGTQKAICELLLGDYTRRGFLDGVGVRLPTICVRPGSPNRAASGFFSAIVREPLNGEEAVLPVPDDVRHWHASPRAAVGFLLHAGTLDGDALGDRRCLTMPGVSATVAEQIEALRRVAGDGAVALIRREPDETVLRIVSGWPRAFDTQRARALGFRAETSFDEIVGVYVEDELGGRVLAGESVTGIALVTGAGSGIGRASALALAEAGFSVVLAGRRREPLDEAAAAGHGAVAITCDVRLPEQVAALFAEIERTFGRLDLLFNNAGVGAPPVPLEELDLARWTAVVETNLTGAFLCTQHAFRIMKRQSPRGGRIINNGSLSASVPRPHSAPYTATKHAITGLTRSTSLDGRAFDIACGQIDIGNAGTDLTEPMSTTGVPQASGAVEREPTIDVAHVARAVVYMASLPLDANVQFMTVMATKMPFVGRG